MKTGIRTTLPFLVLAFLSDWALAGPCDAYYRFDGNLDDEGGNGNAGQMIGPDGAAATARFVEGRSGQALQLDGSAAMRAFVDLNRDRCPQVTVTAWVKIAPMPSQTILGTGGGPWLWASDSLLSLRTAGKDLTARDAIYANGGWMFVAAVWDHAGGTQRLHWHGRRAEDAIGKSPAQAKPAIWVGANNDRLHHPAKDIVIDELRIIGEALDAEQIASVRESTSGGAATVKALSDRETLLRACASNAACPEGSYCGVDGACHPNSQLPMKAAGSGETLDDMRRAQAEQSDDRLDGLDYDSDANLLPGADPIRNANTGTSGQQAPVLPSGPEEPIADPATQAVLSGTVTDGHGKGVGDLTVEVWVIRSGSTFGANQQSITTGVLNTTKTRPDGRFEIAVAAPREVFVVFAFDLGQGFPYRQRQYYGGHVTYLSDAKRIKLEPGKEVSIDMQLDVAECRIEGTVAHGTRVPLPGIRVGLYDPQQTITDRTRPLRSTTTDINGSYSFVFTTIDDWLEVEPAWLAYGINMRLHATDPSGTYEIYGDPLYAGWGVGYERCSRDYSLWMTNP